MRASVGDELLIRGRHVGDEDREGVIVEIRGADGAPPYLVRWRNDHESVFFPPPIRSLSTIPESSKPAE
jgi:hypothetical protein